MKLNLFTKLKLFHINFRRTHEIIYTFLYRIYMIVAIMLTLIGAGYFYGLADFKNPEDAFEMFSFGVGYIFITIFIIPITSGLMKWRKYLFPGTYKTITEEMTKEILKTEEFKNYIPILEEREKKHRFLESKNYFYFNGQLIPKKEIEEFKFEYHSGLKSYERYYIFNIVLKNGSFVKNIYRELAASASKYKDNPITDYLKNFFLPANSIGLTKGVLVKYLDKMEGK
ncbi:MAG: hypothetical protein IJA32_11165 [Lachnospiraceae bacterium]|nr:hypothetical protein [Lachnospiraceae bacterium]